MSTKSSLGNSDQAASRQYLSNLSLPRGAFYVKMQCVSTDAGLRRDLIACFHKLPPCMGRL